MRRLGGDGAQVASGTVPSWLPDAMLGTSALGRTYSGSGRADRSAGGIPVRCAGNGGGAAARSRLPGHCAVGPERCREVDVDRGDCHGNGLRVRGRRTHATQSFRPYRGPSSTKHWSRSSPARSRARGTSCAPRASSRSPNSSTARIVLRRTARCTVMCRYTSSRMGNRFSRSPKAGSAARASTCLTSRGGAVGQRRSRPVGDRRASRPGRRAVRHRDPLSDRSRLSGRAHLRARRAGRESLRL